MRDAAVAIRGIHGDPYAGNKMFRCTHRNSSLLSHCTALAGCLGFGILVMSCDNAPTTPQGLSANDPLHVVQYCDNPTPDCPAPPPNPNDTRVSADVTYSATYTATLNEYFIDPVTGQYTNVMTVSPADVSVHVEAGYAPSGQVRIVTTYVNGIDGTTAVMPQITNQDQAGDYLTDVNAYGYALVTSTPDSMQASPALDLVGTTANGDITAGILVSESDTLVSSQSASPLGTESLSPDRRSRQVSGSDVAAAADMPLGRAFARAASGGRCPSVCTAFPCGFRRSAAAIS